MTVTHALRSLSAYPLPIGALIEISEEVGLDPDGNVTPELRKSREFRKAKAYTYIFLSEVPNVSQGGISYSLSDDERERLRKRGESILEDLGEDLQNGEAEFGYKGEDL